MPSSHLSRLSQAENSLPVSTAEHAYAEQRLATIQARTSKRKPKTWGMVKAALLKKRRR